MGWLSKVLVLWGGYDEEDAEKCRSLLPKSPTKET